MNVQDNYDKQNSVFCRLKTICKRRSEKIILYFIIHSNLKSNNFKLFNDKTNLHSLGVR